MQKLRSKFHFLYHIAIVVFMLGLDLKTARTLKKSCRGSTTPRLDPLNCRQYFQCISGVKYRAQCAPGAVFSKVTKKCEKSAKIPCSANKRKGRPLEGKRCAINGEIRPSEIACEKFLLCRRRIYVGMRCPFGLIFSNTKYRCVEPPDECSTEEDSKLKELNVEPKNPYIGICDNKADKNETLGDPFDCSMYIQCEEDRTDPGNVVMTMNILECPTGLLFQDVKRECMAPSSVFCGQRYRVVNLYGKDIMPPPTNSMRGRRFRIGSAPVERKKKRRPDKPRHWSQPGRYRALSNDNSTTGTDAAQREENEIDASSQNGFSFQTPIKTELHTPIEPPKEDEYYYYSGEETITERSEVHIQSYSLGEKNSSVSSDYNLTETTIFFSNKHENNTQHSPIILKITMGSGGDDSGPAQSAIIAIDDTHFHKTVRSGDEEPLGDKKGYYLKYNLEDVRGHSLEQEEHGPFHFNHSQPRAPKKLSIMDQAYARENGKRFNSTAEDILYYGEDAYYVADSAETTNTTLPRRKLDTFIENLELTHHASKPRKKTLADEDAYYDTNYANYDAF